MTRNNRRRKKQSSQALRNVQRRPGARESNLEGVEISKATQKAVAEILRQRGFTEYQNQ